MIYEKETALLRQGLFEVQNEIGLGHHEEIYHKAMVIWLEQQNIPYTSKAPHPLLFDGAVAYTLYPDLVVWDKITLELKSLPRYLRATEQVQIFNYLKRRNDQLGLLVNMGLDRVFAERIIYDPPTVTRTEDWAHWNDHISGSFRDIGLRIRNVLNALYETHKTGYGTKVLEKLILFGLQKKGLRFKRSPIGTSKFQNRILGETPFDCILVETHFLLVFTALFDDNRFNVSRGRSFMRSLEIPWGVATNFGKKQVQIKALSI